MLFAILVAIFIVNQQQISIVTDWKWGITHSIIVKYSFAFFYLFPPSSSKLFKTALLFHHKNTTLCTLELLIKGYHWKYYLEGEAGVLHHVYTQIFSPLMSKYSVSGKCSELLMSGVPAPLAASEWSKLGKQQERLHSSLLLDQNPFLRESGFLAAWPVCSWRAVQSVWPSFQKCVYRQINKGHLESLQIWGHWFLHPWLSALLGLLPSGVSVGGRGDRAVRQRAKIHFSSFRSMKGSGEFVPFLPLCHVCLLLILITDVCCSKYYLLFFSQGNL